MSEPTLRFLEQHPLLLQIWRFAIVGGLAFVVDFGLLLFLTEIVGLDYLVSATLSFIASVIVNYILSVLWVFTAKGKKRSVFKIVMFFVLATCGLLINNAIMWFSVEILAISYIIGKIVATFEVMVFNFITRKILIEGRLRAQRQYQSSDTSSTPSASTTNVTADK